MRQSQSLQHRDLFPVALQNVPARLRYAETEHGGVLLITHYTRILRYIRPEYVHVFVGGRIAESGGPELADELEQNGYVRFSQAAAAGA